MNSKTKIILPLHQKWSLAILDRKKTIEVRKVFASAQALPTLAFIYTTTPVKAIEGIVSLVKMESMTPHALRALKEKTCIDNETLNAYLQDRNGLAIYLENPRRLKNPISLDVMREFGHTAPQSFAYASQAFEGFVLNQEFI